MEPTDPQLEKAAPVILKRLEVTSVDLTPFTCEDCPFGAKTREPYEEIWHDPSEANYVCPILGRDIWGEQPQCGEFMNSALRRLVQRGIERP